MSTDTLCLDLEMVRRLGNRELPAALVYALITDQSPAGGWVPLTGARITELTGLSRGQARRALDVLVDVGLIERATGSGVGRASYTYRVRGHIAAA